MKRMFLLTAAMIFAGSVASAAITAQSLVQDLTAQGYSRIEIKTGLTQIKAEAISGSTKFEAIYDIATGKLLKSETGPVDLFDDTAPGVELSDRDRDFLRLASSDDDRSDDDSSDDHGSSGHGSDDDGDDDHDGGSDHGDDHGGDSDGNGGHGSDD